MRIIILSQTFYALYPRTAFPEILDNDNRPYFYLTVKIENHSFAIPLRHHIAHPYAFMTIGDAGLDFTKAVIIDDPSDISSTTAWIDTNE